MKDKVVSPVDKEREDKRKRFFQEQEKRLARRQKQMRSVQRREQHERLKVMEEKKLMQERNEIRREAEREHRHLTKLRQEHQVNYCESFWYNVATMIIIVTGSC